MKRQVPAQPHERGIVGKLDGFAKAFYQGLLLGRLSPSLGLALMQRARLWLSQPRLYHRCSAGSTSCTRPSVLRTKPQRGAQPLITPQMAVPGTTTVLPGRT